MSWIGRLKEEIASDICSRQWEDRRTYERRITWKKGLGDGTTQARARAEKQNSKIHRADRWMISSFKPLESGPDYCGHFLLFAHFLF